MEIEKAQNLRKTEDFVLLMAPAGEFGPVAYRLGVASTHRLSLAVKRG
mgnify:FL=1